jgi:hypothetical protein
MFLLLFTEKSFYLINISPKNVEKHIIPEAKE